MRLILITPPEVATENHEQTRVNAMFDAGLRTLHVRKPGASREAVRAYLDAIEPRHLCRVVLHSHHDMALEYGVKVCVLCVGFACVRVLRGGWGQREGRAAK